MAAIVLLPGLDGTGTMLLDFVSALGMEFEVIVVCYPSDQALDYPALEAVARERLPVGEPFILVAESFSGPIAISLAASGVTELRGLVLCSTFARCPRPVFRLLRWLVPLIRTSLFPAFAIRALLLGRWSNVTLLRALRASLAKISVAALRVRLRSVVSVNVLDKLQGVSVPVLYVRGSKDRLVPSSAGRLIVQNAPAAHVVEFAGPHCLLQVAPAVVAPVVLGFARGLGLPQVTSPRMEASPAALRR